jgi:hypothetical protein
MMGTATGIIVGSSVGSDEVSGRSGRRSMISGIVRVHGRDGIRLARGRHGGRAMVRLVVVVKI